MSERVVSRQADEPSDRRNRSTNCSMLRARCRWKTEPFEMASSAATSSTFVPWYPRSANALSAVSTIKVALSDGSGFLGPWLGGH